MFPRRGVCLPASLFVACLCPVKTAVRIEVLLDVKTLGGPRSSVLERGPDLLMGKGVGGNSVCCAVRVEGRAFNAAIA